MISSLLLLITLVGLGIPTAVLFIPWSILTGNPTALYNATQMIVRTGYFLARIRVEATGRDLIPKNTACIFIGEPRLQSRSTRAPSENPGGALQLFSSDL